MPPIRAVIIDFDETIADSSAGRHLAMRRTVAHHLEREIDDAEIRLVNRGFSPLEDQMAHLAGAPGGLADAMVRTFREHYYGDDRLPPTMYSGMLQAIAELHSDGLPLAVVTSRFRHAHKDGLTWGVLPDLELLGLTRYFTAIVGYEDTEDHKPAPAPFLKALELLGFAPHEVLGVGDSPLDVRAARAAGLHAAAGALWGTLDRDSLRRENPDYLLESPEELPRIVR